MAEHEQVGRQDVEALVESFAERIERTVAERADAQVSVRRAGAASARAAATRQLVLGIVGVDLAHAAQGRQHP